MVKLIFITGNQQKFQQARNALRGHNIKLTNKKLEIPEIQDVDIKKVAEFSAKYAANKLNEPVVVTDAGYYIKSLSGFPGPFIKFINEWLKPKDLLRLMKGKSDRSISSPICVAYCEPNKEPVSFVSDNQGTLAKKPGGKGSTIDQLYVPKGYKKTIGNLPPNERLSLWNIDCWNKLAVFLQKKNPLVLKKAT